MEKRTKIKVITTIICLLFSLFALYTFLFVANISIGWRIALIVIAIVPMLILFPLIQKYFKKGVMVGSVK